MEIIKQKSEIGTYDFYITKENQTLYITFSGNGDLYWIINNQKINAETFEEHLKHLQSPYQEIFTITKENYHIYSLFNELIEDIKEARIHIPEEEKNDDFLIDFEDLFEEYENLYTEDHESPVERCNRKNAEYKDYSRYKWLYHDGIISWHSDEHIYEDANRVKIYKEDENIILEFSRPPVKEEELIYHMTGSIGIRFRNSGSTYEPFNQIFMRLYNKLGEYDPNYHQIHLEEIEYQKKLKKQNDKK